MLSRSRSLTLLASILLLLWGCSQRESAPPPSPQEANPTHVIEPEPVIHAEPIIGEDDHDHDHDHQGHAHTAPHGGTLVVLGDEFAHLELVLDAAAGQLTVYVLDGEAVGGVRLAQEQLELLIRLPEHDDDVLVVCHAAPNVLTGETIGDTSEFRGASRSLIGASRFDVAIKSITIKGQEFAGLRFPFPEGNH